MGCCPTLLDESRRARNSWSGVPRGEDCTRARGAVLVCCCRGACKTALCVSEWTFRSSGWVVSSGAAYKKRNKATGDTSRCLSECKSLERRCRGRGTDQILTIQGKKKKKQQRRMSIKRTPRTRVGGMETIPIGCAHFLTSAGCEALQRALRYARRGKETEKTNAAKGRRK